MLLVIYYMDKPAGLVTVLVVVVVVVAICGVVVVVAAVVVVVVVGVGVMSAATLNRRATASSTHCAAASRRSACRSPMTCNAFHLFGATLMGACVVAVVTRPGWYSNNSLMQDKIAQQQC